MKTLREKLDAASINQIEEKSLATLDAILKKKFKQRLEQGKNYLLHQVAQQMCKQFIASERATIKAGAKLHLMGLEQELKHVLNCSGFELNLFGKVDRVDELNGQWRILDYKTGR